jgi:hypothetical protein
MDEAGNGKPVQQSLLEANGDWHMQRAVLHFKRANPDRWKLLRVIMVDKDLNEIRVLQSHFPEARVLICHFHVVKYLSLICRKPEFGKFSADDLESVDALVHGMVYATSDEDYEAKRESLRGLCVRIGLVGFFSTWTRTGTRAKICGFSGAVRSFHTFEITRIIVWRIFSASSRMGLPQQAACLRRSKRWRHMQGVKRRSTCSTLVQVVM